MNAKFAKVVAEGDGIIGDPRKFSIVRHQIDSGLCNEPEWREANVLNED